MNKPQVILTVMPSRAKYLVLLCIALSFVIFSTVFIAHGESEKRWVGWLALVFFGSGIPLFSKQLFDRRPRVILSELGVFDRTLGVGIIPWADITGAYLKTSYGNAFICLQLHDEGKWLSQLSQVHRTLTTANTQLGFQALNINLSGTSANPELVLNIVLRKLGKYHPISKHYQPPLS